MIIIDACRYRSAKEIRQELTLDNTVFLQGTIDGKGAREDLYLQFLAMNICQGNDTVDKMHKRASREVRTYQKSMSKSGTRSSNEKRMKHVTRQQEATKKALEKNKPLCKETLLKKIFDEYDTDEYNSDDDDEDSCESESSDEEAGTERWSQDDDPKEKQLKARPKTIQPNKSEKKVQKPMLAATTSKSIVLRRYHDEKCRKCDEAIVTDSEYFVVCEKCFGSYHFRCVKLTASSMTRETLDNPYVHLVCEYCI